MTLRETIQKIKTLASKHPEAEVCVNNYGNINDVIINEYFEAELISDGTENFSVEYLWNNIQKRVKENPQILDLTLVSYEGYETVTQCDYSTWLTGQTSLLFDE